MRFTSNAFIVSTVALLSLITPVVNADAVQFTSPTPGQKINAPSSIDVAWTVADFQGLANVNVDIALLHASAPQSPAILQSNVPILNGHSNVQIQDVESRDDYFLELISDDKTTVYSKSGTFSIV